MSGHRQAALALHALAPQDRNLILAELPGSDSAVLREYLAELEELGFDAELAVDAFAPSAPEPVPAPSPATLLRTATPADMLDAIGHEPASLIGCLLSIEAWPWAPRFLDMLPLARRAAVRKAIDTAAAPARARFLMEAAAAALERRHAGMAGSRLASFMALVKSWAR
jgi:hypothetical protein